MLRLDDGGKDPAHVQACRKAVLAYAEAIQGYLPKLAEDIRGRYGESVGKIKPPIKPAAPREFAKAVVDPKSPDHPEV